MNSKMTDILKYAKCSRTFTASAFLSSLHGQEQMSKASLYWYLNQLISMGLLSRTGRGRYSILTKSEFTPVIEERMSEVNETLRARYPFAETCLYSGSSISPLTHHIAPNSALYVEVSRPALEGVFSTLRELGYAAFLKPNKDVMYNYVELDKSPVIVKPLVTGSPLRNTDGISVPTIEKLLVDMFCDDDFFYMQGSEYNRVMENAYEKFNINDTTLLRYAGRRGVREELEPLVNEIFNRTQHDR